MDKTRVVIVDDSALVRRLLSEILSSDPQIEVVATAVDAYEARDEIKKHNPHVITLDIEMPKMDGLTFLKNLMRLRPMPVVMISSLTQKNADMTLRALELGAVDFVSKPKADLDSTLNSFTDEIINKIKIARYAKVKSLQGPKVTSTDVEKTHKNKIVLSKNRKQQNYRATEQLIAIGASTGGTEAARSIIEALPANFPPILIVQHIPAVFSAAFAQRMDSLSAMTVYEAEDGQKIMHGHVYVAPGGQHLMAVRDGAVFRCKLTNDEPVNRHRPSVDVLFHSVAHNIGASAVGVILTGMGRDGAEGLKDMKNIGCKTIAQDENTSIVWGMPGEAVKQGIIDQTLPLNTIAPSLQKLCPEKDKQIVSSKQIVAN